jgi:hypothetical protein
MARVRPSSRTMRITGAMTIAVAAVVATQGPASAHLSGCTLNAQNPHISYNEHAVSLGIVAKSTMKCDHYHDGGEINLTLYRCDYKPSSKPDENWIFDNCDFVDWVFHKISPLKKGQSYTRQIPTAGSGKYIHGKGYYVNDTVFVTHNNGNTDSIGRNSYVVYVDG